ncbi:MAG: YlxR family protein [Coriobacteriales bacterium]|nr:YlxR family protein [Coriobacteriales bacterium]
MPMKRRQPQRTCIACRTGADKRQLVRFVRVVAPKQGASADDRPSSVQCDPTGRLAGRGAYLCADEKCFEKARRSHSFERALRCTVTAADYERLQKEFNRLCAHLRHRVGMVGNA